MAKDKYTAVWLSHSSIADFIKCPRAYYLRNVYKDPRTGHKMTVMTPPLALGQVIHEVIDDLSKLPYDERFNIPLSQRLEKKWGGIAGKLGGFKDGNEDIQHKKRGLSMLNRLEANPGPLKRRAIPKKEELPFYWLSEEENLILCGKIDWMEYLEETDSIHIIDFKTGKNDEDGDSLQLPIYYLLATNTQAKKITKLSYWYIDRMDEPLPQALPDPKESYEKVMELGRRIKLARQINHFKCPKGGCYSCRPLERVLKGEAKLVGVGNYGQDIYILD